MFGDEAEELEVGGGVFEEAVRAAFPDNAWDPDRIAAFKEAIKICAAQDYEDEEEVTPKPPKKGGDVDLALIFGGPKKAKK